MKKEMSNEVTSYIGKVLFYNEVVANREIHRYKRYVESIKPVIEDFYKMGVSPLTDNILMQIVSGNFSFYLNEFREKAENDIQHVGFVFRPVGESQIKKSLEAITAALEKLRFFLKNSDDQYDCPVVDGFPTLTDYFTEQVKDKHRTKINTEKGSHFYDAFLEAQKALKVFVDLGYSPGQYLEFDHIDGLDLIGFIE